MTTFVGATNLQKEDESVNEVKTSNSSSGGGSKPIRPRGKLLNFSESTLESSVIVHSLFLCVS